YLTVTPCNMGAQPASAGLLNPLGPDEDLGFALLHALDADQRGQAVIHTVAPADYATRQVPLIGQVEYPDFIDLGIPFYRITAADREALKFSKDSPAGVCGSELSGAQQDLLFRLVAGYVNRMPAELAARQLARVERDGPEGLYFCWAGAGERGKPHYYR